MRFDFVDKSDPTNYIVGLARKMPKFKNADDMAHLIRHSFVAEDYKPELLDQVVQILADP